MEQKTTLPFFRHQYIHIFILAICLGFVSTNVSAQTFDWETAIDTGLTVTEVKNFITVTASRDTTTIHLLNNIK